MSNPAVLSLASLEAVGDVGYRFEIEKKTKTPAHFRPLSPYSNHRPFIIIGIFPRITDFPVIQNLL